MKIYCWNTLDLLHFCFQYLFTKKISLKLIYSFWNIKSKLSRVEVACNTSIIIFLKKYRKFPSIDIFSLQHEQPNENNCIVICLSLRPVELNYVNQTVKLATLVWIISCFFCEYWISPDITYSLNKINKKNFIFNDFIERKYNCNKIDTVESNKLYRIP